jgi:hypothetical protein
MEGKLATLRFELGWSEGVFGAFHLFLYDSFLGKRKENGLGKQIPFYSIVIGLHCFYADVSDE